MNTKFIKTFACYTLTFLSITACKESSTTEVPASKTEVQQEDTVTAIFQGEAVKKIAIDEVHGYTLKNSVKLPDTVECFVFSSQEQFDQYFQTTAASKNKSSKIDFEKLHLAAIVHSKSKFKTDIRLGEVVQTGTQATVNFTIGKENKQTEPSISFLLFSFANTTDLQSIAFLQSGQTIYNYYFADAD